MFKAAEVERKRNKSTYPYANKSLFVQNFRPLFLTVSAVVVMRVIKACVRYFWSNFYFQPNDSSSKTMKNVFYFT